MSLPKSQGPFFRSLSLSLSRSHCLSLLWRQAKPKPKAAAAQRAQSPRPQAKTQPKAGGVAGRWQGRAVCSSVGATLLASHLQTKPHRISTVWRAVCGTLWVALTRPFLLADCVPASGDRLARHLVINMQSESVSINALPAGRLCPSW